MVGRGKGTPRHEQRAALGEGAGGGATPGRPSRHPSVLLLLGTGDGSVLWVLWRRQNGVISELSYLVDYRDTFVEDFFKS